MKTITIALSEENKRVEKKFPLDPILALDPGMAGAGLLQTLDQLMAELDKIPDPVTVPIPQVPTVRKPRDLTFARSAKKPVDKKPE